MSVANAEIFGRWQMVRAEFDGESAPDEVAQRTTIEFTTTHYTVQFDDATVDHGTLAFPKVSDPARADIPTSFAAVTLHGSSGTNVGRKIPCIYQRVGDRLRICFGFSGIPPTDFSTRIGQQRYLATYRTL